jgi:hypothetical protein
MEYRLELFSIFGTGIFIWIIIDLPALSLLYLVPRFQFGVFIDDFTKRPSSTPNTRQTTKYISRQFIDRITQTLARRLYSDAKLHVQEERRVHLKVDWTKWFLSVKSEVGTSAGCTVVVIIMVGLVVQQISKQYSTSTKALHLFRRENFRRLWQSYEVSFEINCEESLIDLLVIHTDL